jgi:hypothetical protein
MTQNVLDNWEDLEYLEYLEYLEDLEDLEDFNISNTLINKTVNKIIEERKLVEAADNELTNSLFSDSKPINKELICESTIHPNISKKPSTTFKKDKIIENKEILEKKQKESSSKIKTNKQQMSKQMSKQIMKQTEIFGECCNDDNYIKYCDIEVKYLD